MHASGDAPAMILVNGRVHTMDDDRSRAEAVAIGDGRIVAVGDAEEVQARAPRGARVVDLTGATVIPGLIDAHNHLLSTGLMLTQIQLYDCRSIGEIVARVAARVAETAAGRWIVGRGWDESLLAERRHPTRDDLDTVAPDHPVVLHRVWNKLVCNSAALRAAGVTAATPDPPTDVAYAGGFERDGAGEPTGLFRDRAKALILDAVPPPDEDELVEAVGIASRAFVESGLTGIAEPGLYPDHIRAFERARRERALLVRADLLMAGWGFGSAADDAALEERFSSLDPAALPADDWLRVTGIKLMPDGGVGDRTARMFAPYPLEPDNRGIWVVEPRTLAARIRWVHDRGWSMDIHTCGDEAQEVTVRAIADAQRANPNPTLRHHVHHAYFPTEQVLRLMADHDIPALVSAPFLTNLGESFVVSVGEERASQAMPARTYLEAGVTVVGSSDSPITDYRPLAGLRALVERTTVAGRTLGESERLTPAEALRAYTLSAARALGCADRRGSITPGKLADLVVLDRDPIAGDDGALATVRPVATMAGGEWVFGAV